MALKEKKEAPAPPKAEAVEVKGFEGQGSSAERHPQPREKEDPPTTHLPEAQDTGLQRQPKYPRKSTPR